MMIGNYFGFGRFSKDQALNVTMKSKCLASRLPDRNQDCILLDSDRSFISLASGNGQNSQGEMASAFAVNRLKRALDDAYTDKGEWAWPSTYGPNPFSIAPPTPADLLKKGIEIVNQYLHDFILRNPEGEGMSTTLLGAVILKDKLFAAVTGGCRVLLFRHKQALRLDGGETGARLPFLSPAETKPSVSWIQTFEMDLRPTDRLLFATSGLDSVSESSIKRIMTEPKRLATEITDDLIAEVQICGPENDTGLVVVTTDPHELKGG